MSPANNFDKPALNHRLIRVKEGQEVPALDPFWVETRPFTKYYSCPLEKPPFAVEEWLVDTGHFRDDLEWLLQLEFHRFWSQVVHDPRVIQSLASFLQESHPCYAPLSTLTTNEKVLNTYGEVLRASTTLICRLITARESDVNWMSREFLGETLYSNYLLSIPMLVDLILALGPENHQLLGKIMGDTTKVQPKYLNDLQSALEYIQLSFQSVAQQVASYQKSEIDDPINLETVGLENLALYALDCSVTLSLVLEVFPPACKIADELKMTASVSQFYDECISELYKLICENSKNQAEGLKHLNNARIELINAFRCVVNFFSEAFLNQPRDTDALAEKIVGLFEESMDHSFFVVDFQKMFPVENDLDILRQACGDPQKLRLNYVQAGYRDGVVPTDKPEEQPEVESEEEEEAPVANGHAPEPKNDLESNIKKVLDVFPDYGDGFVRKLLARYDSNPEAAISAILEGNLPPDLAEASTSEPYIPPERADFFVETGIQRLNVFDGDAYDVMTQDNVKGIYKKGVGEPKKWGTLLDDKTHIESLKPMYQKLGYVEENEYDDEYDDSYDALADSEAKTVKFKAARGVVVDEVESEEEEEPPQAPQQPRRDTNNDFCENPEVARARYEQMRQAKFGRGGSRGDVAGKPKGQGQSDDTQKSRQKKETHKASTGNHSRKKQATWKQSRGMY